MRPVLNSNLDTKPYIRFPLVSWKAIFAGFFVALLVNWTLNFMGVGIGALSLVDSGTPGAGLAVGSLVWMIGSTMISLFLGAYFATRIANLSVPQLGIGQGAVLASFFFTIASVGAGIGALSAAKGIGTVLMIPASAASYSVANNSSLMESTIETTLGTTELKAPADEIMKGVAARLIQGKPENAKAYLARQTSLTQAEIDQKIEGLKIEAEKVKNAAATAVAAFAWAVCATLILGTAASMLGGWLGSFISFRKPMKKQQYEETRSTYATAI